MGQQVEFEAGQVWEVTYPYDVKPPYLVRLLKLDHEPAAGVQMWQSELVIGEPAYCSAHFPEDRFANTTRFGLGPLNEMEVLAWARRW